MPKYVMPPRQKMINLIYIVLIAMLGINISQDALEGYDLISKDYQPQVALLKTHNVNLQKCLEKDKPELKSVARQIREKTKALQQKLNELKEKIVQKADCKKQQDGKLLNRDNMHATSDVMLNSGQGKELRKNIENYKMQMDMLITNTELQNLLKSYLNLTPQKNSSSWEIDMFSHLTANAGITVLTKLEEELLTYEKEVLQGLLNKNMSQRKQDSLLIDNHKIYINGNSIDVLPNGTIQTPMVQISPELTSILYKGYKNKLHFISVGIAEQDLRISMKNGNILERNGQYWAVPDRTVQTASIIVNKGNETLARYEYVVKNLPDPVPYVIYTEQGKQRLYKGNVPLSKSKVQTMTELVATTYEGPQIAYRILSFETVFIKSGSNKVITLKTQGNKFTDEQRRIITQLESGDKFYITSITVSGGQKNNEQIASVNIVLI